MNLLDPKTTEFQLLENDRLTVRLGDEAIEDVHCVMLFPFSAQEEFISVVGKRANVDDDGEEAKGEEEELGIIEDLSVLNAEQQEIVRQAIDNRYFMPEIATIESIHSEHGLDEWTVLTDRGPRVFYVTEVKDNLTVDARGMVLVTDIEGCRYKIPDPNALPPSDQAQLAKVML
ncbi:MAG: DUF1854 domain-containing protein [Planctomycetota bacterium]|jgi:hypothetical protein